jgi:hypothetical protein
MKSKGTYILDGKTPVVCEDYLEWSIWLGTADRKVGFTRIANVDISTVFIGVDMSDDNPPRVFETMLSVFEDEEMAPELAEAMKRQFSNRISRTCSWDEAQIVHDATIEKVKQALVAAEKSLRKKTCLDSDANSHQP